MIQEYIDAFQKNKEKLKEPFSKYEWSHNYPKLLKQTIELTINPELKEYDKLDTENIVTIDHGDYQGTQIYLIPQDHYQPSVDEYIWTHNYYGSCSGCDAMLAATTATDEKEQIEKLLKIALQQVERMKVLGS